MATFETVLAVHSVAIPAHLAAQATVPVLRGLQRQGDLLIVPAADEATTPVPQEGCPLVVGEATGNTHWLHGAGPIFFDREDGHVVGTLTVPQGSVAYLVHTEEHGANGMGSGSYSIRRAREWADEIRLVAD
jgi:hypothetical protein